MNNDEKEIIKDDTQETLDEVMVEQVDEALEENEEELEVKKSKKGLPETLGLLLVGVVDQIVVASMSVILLFVFNVLIGFLGYQIKEVLPMFLVMYVIINISYKLICKLCNFKGTFGTRIVHNE